MAEAVQRFFSALAFFTRLPIPGWIEHSPEQQRRAVCFAPLIGWLVGGVAALTWLAASVFLPATIAVILTITATVWLTGALHEDGFADVCDGFGASRNPTRIIEIMKDSRCGVYAVLGLSLLLLVKFAALSELAGRVPPAALAGVLICAHSFSRLMMVALMVFQDYAVSGRAKSGFIAARPPGGDFLLAAVCGLLPLLAMALLGMAWGLPAVLPTVLAGLWLASLFQRRLGGYVGDCLGCVQQVSEAVFYLGVCAVLPLP